MVVIAWILFITLFVSIFIIYYLDLHNDLIAEEKDNLIYELIDEDSQLYLFVYNTIDNAVCYAIAKEQVITKNFEDIILEYILIVINIKIGEDKFREKYNLTKENKIIDQEIIETAVKKILESEEIKLHIDEVRRRNGY